jgi:MFS family permease
MRASPEPSGAGAPAPESRNPLLAPGFARWWLASLTAGIGVGIQSVTVPLFVRDRVGTDVRAAAIAGALVAATLPGVVLALVGGAMADRVERRRILVRSYAVAALVSCAYVALASVDVRSVWPVYPLAAVVGSAGAFTNPARSSMLPLLVTRAQLQNGVILGTTLGFVAANQLLGPTVAGLLAEGFGLRVAFAAEVVLLVGAAALFGGIRTGTPTSSGKSVLADLREGIRYVRRAPALRGLLLLALVPGVCFIGPFAVTIALVVPDILHVSDKWVGILWGCFGGGVVTGSLLLAWKPIPRRGLAICVANVAGGLILVAYSQSRSLGASAAILVLWGMGASIFMNYVIALLQERTAPHMIGRVMSMYSLAFFVSMPAGHLQAGAVTSAFGPVACLLASGLAATAVGVACLVGVRSVRALV